MICRIADFNIDLKGIYTRLRDMCEEYRCDDAESIDFSIHTTNEDVDSERERAKTQDLYNNERESILETWAAYRKIVAEVLKRNAFLMHGVAIEHEGRGYIFTAASGTGKTTHVKLWKEAFGDENVTIINGDKPILRFLDDKVYAYGTPWNGKEHYGTTGRTAIDGVCFLKRGEKNAIRRITTEEAVPLMFSQIMIADSTDLARQLELVDMFFEKVPAYILECNMDVSAAVVAKSALTEKDN